MNHSKEELLVPCECLSEILRIERWSDEEGQVSMQLYKYFSVDNISFWRRVKMAFEVLRGREINTADIIISKENWNKIKNF